MCVSDPMGGGQGFIQDYCGGYCKGLKYGEFSMFLSLLGSFFIISPEVNHLNLF